MIFSFALFVIVILFLIRLCKASEFPLSQSQTVTPESQSLYFWQGTDYFFPAAVHSNTLFVSQLQISADKLKKLVAMGLNEQVAIAQYEELREKNAVSYKRCRWS